MVDWPRRRAHLGSWETLDDAERAWLIGSRRAARRRTALVVGLAVVAVSVPLLLAYRRFQR